MTKREYQRAYAARRRRAAWVEQARSSRTCPARIGRHGTCGAVLESRTDGAGALVISCPRCDRRRRGICRDCPAPVAGAIGKALRCAACKRRANLDALERYQREHRAELRERARAYSQREDVRARKIEYKRLYRAAHPEKVRGYKRKEALQQSARTREYHRRYNAMRAEEKRAEAREKYRALHLVPTPTCRSCALEIPWNARGQAGQVGRPPVRCVFCEAREKPGALRAAIARWVRHEDAPERTKAAPRVRKLRIKCPMPTRLTNDGVRLCVADGCPNPVSGRAKKCTSCREHARVIARALLSEYAA